MKELTSNSTQQLELVGHDVGRLGIFEWLATTIVYSPDMLTKNLNGILAGNRIESASGDLVPIPSFINNNPGIQLQPIQETRYSPRLAIL